MTDPLPPTQAPGRFIPSFSSTQVETLVPLVQAVGDQIGDANQQVEVLTAQIKNMRRLIRTTPVGKELLRMRLRKLIARKKAAQRRLVKQQEGESSTRTYRVLGQVAGIAGIGLVLALAVRALRRSA